MIKSAQKATRGEGGFTLIELLVVMIIIAILMAVAVPTFLKQKQTAVGTKAKANIRQVQNAVESCAAGNTSGSVNSRVPGERLCATPGVLQVDEPSLTPLFAAGGPEAVTVAEDTQMGYVIRANFLAEGGDPGFFELRNDGRGGITKTCAPATSKAGCVGGVWK